MEHARWCAVVQRHTSAQEVCATDRDQQRKLRYVGSLRLHRVNFRSRRAPAASDECQQTPQKCRGDRSAPQTPHGKCERATHDSHKGDRSTRHSPPLTSAKCEIVTYAISAAVRSTRMPPHPAPEAYIWQYRQTARMTRRSATATR